MMFEAELNYTIRDLLHYIRLHRKTRQKAAYWIRIVVNIAISAFFVFAYTFYFRFARQDSGLLSRLLLFTALAAFLQFTDYLSAFFMLKNLRSTGTARCHVEEDAFVICDEKAKSEYAYSGFADLLYSTKTQTYYCYIAKKMAIVIPERCFIQGDPAAFGAFLAEKTGLEVKEIK